MQGQRLHTHEAGFGPGPHPSQVVEMMHGKSSTLGLAQNKHLIHITYCYYCPMSKPSHK